MKRRILAILLVLCMVLPFMPTITFAVGSYAGPCGENVRYEFNGTTGKLTIYGSGTMQDWNQGLVSGNDYPYWNSFWEHIKTVEIQSGVTNVANGAFIACKQLSKVTLANTVTRIGNEAFADCPQLTAITLPSNLQEIGEEAFYGTPLTSITLPDSLKTIGAKAFTDTPIAGDLVIPAGVTAINENTFGGCNNLKTVTFKGQLTDIGDEAFYNCDGLTTVTFEKGMKGEIGEHAFAYCDNLTGIDIPEGVTYIHDDAFVQCKSLSKVTLPNTLVSIGSGAFRECKALTSITIPKSVEWMSGLFTFCDNLHDVTIHSDTVNVMKRDNFDACDNLKYVHILGNAPTTKEENVFGHNDPVRREEDLIIFYDEGTTGWNPPVWNEYEIQIWGLPNPVRTGTCGKNVKWTLKDGVLTISGTGPMDNFSHWEENMPSWNYFRNKITTVIIEEGVTSIGDYAFSHDYHIINRNYMNLSSVTVPASVASIGKGAFQDCHALTTVKLSEGLKTIGDDAFDSCDAITELSLPNSLTHIGNSAFRQSLADFDITIPTAMTEIPKHAFSGSFIKSVVLHDRVTAIGREAFASCKGLIEITIPASVTQIDMSAFYCCDNLKTVRFQGNAPAIGSAIFIGDVLTAYYPAGDETWTEEVRQDYNGEVTWEAYCAKHNYTITDEQAAACTEDGKITYTCAICGDIYTEEIPVLGHDFTDVIPIFNGETRTHIYTCNRCEEEEAEVCTFDEGTVTTEATVNNLGIREHTCTVCGGSYEESYVCRLYGSSRYDTAYAVAEALKEQLGVEKFENIIVANGLGYADALAGSYLAAVKNAPILLVNQNRMRQVADYIRENLAEGGMVYLLGGETAIPTEMVDLLVDVAVKRLEGRNRYLTNMAVLEEAGTEDQEILICSGRDFPDSLSASTVGKPILLVNKTLNDYQMEFLANSSGEFVIIGGTGAVSEEIEKDLEEFGEVTRLGGAGRYETCVMVAQHFFPDGADKAIVAYSRNFPDGLCGGPLAYAMKAPLLLLQNDRGPQVIEYARKTGIKSGAVLGGPGLIDDANVNKVFVK